MVLSFMSLSILFMFVLRFYGQVNLMESCVEVLRPCQSTGVMSRVVSLPDHTFTGQV